MNINVLKEDKHEVTLEIDNATTAEALRVYLYEVGVDFAAWKREHPSKPLLMTIKCADKTIGKVVGEAIATLKKDANSLLK